MKISIIGSNGQLGQDLVRVFKQRGDEVVELNHADLDIADATAVNAILSQRQPEVVVNTAAMHHVENCEKTPEQAFAVNAIGARNLAMASLQLGFRLIHVSTDYVFDGN